MGESPGPSTAAETRAYIREHWSRPDQFRILNSTVLVGEQLCEDAVLTAGQRVLDVACGTGNTALAAARRFNRVTGLDMTPALLERARLRAEAEGFEVEWVEGDAEALPFPDDSFDCVTSTFGVMFAPNQEKAAAELLRVVRPGGTVAVASWTPTGFMGRIFTLVAEHLPETGPTVVALRWGTQEGLTALFGGAAGHLELVDRSFRMRAPSIEAYVERNLVSRPALTLLSDEQQDTYRRDLTELIDSYNRATDGTMLATADYITAIYRPASA